MEHTKEVRAYVETLLWSEVDEDGTPLDDNYAIEDMAEEAIKDIEKDIASFALLTGEVEGFEMWELMHDLVLTRNGHGAGFWDGDYPKELGEYLTKWANSLGETHAYVGDDGKIYVC